VYESAYLICTKAGGLTLLRRAPKSARANEVVVLITINIPNEYFERPKLSVNITAEKPEPHEQKIDIMAMQESLRVAGFNVIVTQPDADGGDA